MIKMAGKELSETVKILVIFHIIFEGMNQREAAVAEAISLESANKVWREFCDLVTMNGLVPVLESMNLPGAVELAELAREMRRHHVTPRQCNQVLPLVVVFRNLKLDPHLIPGLLEAALQLGGKDFPRDECAAAIARIRRREKETGLTIEQVDAAHQAASGEVIQLRAESAKLQTAIHKQRATITSLQNQSSRLTEEIQGKQQRLDALDTRIASEGTTLQELDEYAADKLYFVNLGFDIRDVRSVRAVFSSLASMNYNPVLIINMINQTGNLQEALRKLLGKVGENQNKLQNLTEAQDTLRKEIQKLQEKKKDEENRVDQTKREADREIVELQRNLNNKLKAADATEKLLSEYVADREKLRSWGMEF